MPAFRRDVLRQCSGWKGYLSADLTIYATGVLNIRIYFRNCYIKLVSICLFKEINIILLLNLIESIPLCTRNYKYYITVW